MAYVSIPKDLTQVRTKFLMGLTKRQTVCFGAAAAVGLPLFFLLRNFTSTSAAAFVMVVVMLPWFMFAMYERNGQPLEKYLMCIYSVHFKRPKIRTYQTQCIYAANAHAATETINQTATVRRQSQQEQEGQSVVRKNKGNIPTEKQNRERRGG